MTIAEKIFALWGADAAAIALVPTDRFKYIGPYQDVDTPYVFFFPVIQQRYRTLTEGAANALEYGTWQFSIYATSSSSADAIRLKLISVFDGNKAGFNFIYQTSRLVDKTPDGDVLLYAADFLVTAA